MMELDRVTGPEILDQRLFPEWLASQSYRELTTIHRLVGNTSYLISALRRNPYPVKRILDVGCGHGGLLKEISKRLKVEGLGVDISPPKLSAVPILKADAAFDPLPKADVAFPTYVAHHVSEANLVHMIRNIGKSSPRFILLDVVRHWIPLALFRMFVAPFVSSITRADGQTSIRRGYKPEELEAVVTKAIAGTNAKFHHSISLLGLRQVVDISYF